jgi:hypothetical protein
MTDDRGPEDHFAVDARQAELIARLVDGEPSDECLADLADLLRSSPACRKALVGHLLLDSLLPEDLGPESLSALVDIVGDGEPLPPVGAARVKGPASEDGARDASGRARRSWPRRVEPLSGVRRWRTVGWVGAGVVGLVSLVIGIALRDQTGAASAAHVIQVAEVVHAEPVERVYLVDVVRESDATADLVPPRDTRVATQGDRFYVEMRRGDRHWFWGRDAAGAIWVTVGRDRAVIVDDDEQGVGLRYLGELYTLNLETLLRTFRTFCRLAHATGSAGTHVIDVTPRVALARGGMRHATIEVDRETKAVRRLVLEREVPHYGRSTVTFTLVDTRPADEPRYGPLGHVEEPALILDRATPPAERRNVLVRWFGASANRWMLVPEETEDAR